MCLPMSCMCITFLSLSARVNICHCMCLPVTHYLSSSLALPPAITFFLTERACRGIWVELITVGARKAGTKTLHRQHNSGGRHQTGSTQSSQSGPKLSRADRDDQHLKYLVQRVNFIERFAANRSYFSLNLQRLSLSRSAAVFCRFCICGDLA